MNVVPVSVRGGATAVRSALLSHGWEGEVASLTAGGLTVNAFHVTGLDIATIEAMVPLATRLGLELVTGDDWLLLAGSRSRLGAFARPWLQPEPVRDLAYAVGTAMPGEPAAAWRHREGTIALDAPVIVGVINVTPDSFSEPTRTPETTAAVQRAALLLEGGATVLDIGGESTRPGAVPLDSDVEQARVVPAIAAVRAAHPGVPISVDTVHAATARAALGAGAVIINDVTAGRHDPDLLQVAAEFGAAVVLSHSRGAMGALTLPDVGDFGDDVVGAVSAELQASRQTAVGRGIAPESIVLDPGFGFGKSAAQNWQLLAGLDAVAGLGSPVLVGVSRKRFLGEATGRSVEDRDRATAAACALAWSNGARLFRVHDPAAVRDALAVARAVTP